MKNLIITLVVFLALCSFSPTNAIAANVTSASDTATAEPSEIQALRGRIDEIKAMDKSALSRAERKELRNELKSTKATVAASRGVYLSIGAIIIIILLLILIL